MIEINKNKLIPAVTANWGEIVGDIDSQKDLVSKFSSYATEDWVSSQQFATEEWVESQGYLTSVPDTFATKQWVSDQSYITSTALTGYATESWVESQGYLTSVPDTFATKQWVSDQGYLTSETLPSDIATQSWVESQGYLTTESLSGYATESWVQSQGYLTATALEGYATESWVSSQGFTTESWVQSQGYLTTSTDPLLQYNRQIPAMGCRFIDAPLSITSSTNTFVNVIDSDVYLYATGYSSSDYRGYIYKFNTSTMHFDFYAIPYNSAGERILGNYPMWKSPVSDFICLGNVGYIYVQNSPGPVKNTLQLVVSDLGGNYIKYSTHKDNICSVGSHIYMIDYQNGLAYQWNNKKYFKSTVYTTDCSFNSLPRFKTYVEGECIYAVSGVMYRFVEDTVNQTVNVESLSTPLYPLINESLPDSDRVHKIGSYYIYYIKPYVYKWTPGTSEWELLDFDLENFTYNPCGAECGEYMFGCGYTTGTSGIGYRKILLWNFTSSDYHPIYSFEEATYDFQDSYNLNGTLTALNQYNMTQSINEISSQLGSAINLTQNILS